MVSETSFIAGFRVGHHPNKAHLVHLGVTSSSLFFKSGKHINLIYFFFLWLKYS